MHSYFHAKLFETALNIADKRIVTINVKKPLAKKVDNLNERNEFQREKSSIASISGKKITRPTADRYTQNLL